MKYYEKIIEQKPLAIDYMNAGHVAWTMGDIQKAAALYGKSITANGNRERFLEMFRKDKGSSSQTRYSRRGHPVNAGFIITSSVPRTVSVWGVPLYYKSCRNRLLPLYIRSIPALHTLPLYP